MPPNSSDVSVLYTKGIAKYKSFISFFRSPQAMLSLLLRSDLLRPGLRMLDAGCGFGMATFALLEAMRRRNFDFERIDAFDLTPAMLDRFQSEIQKRGVARVQLRQCDVLALGALPATWTNYDLILSTSMLEYLPKQELARALSALRARLTPQGRILVVITKRTLEAKVLIEWWWHANRYTKDELRLAFQEAGFVHLVFRSFPSRYFWLNRASQVVEARNATVA
jgi:cyclopropane fatty-acyl-phospholipid synthase-like methyltransferase